MAGRALPGVRRPQARLRERASRGGCAQGRGSRVRTRAASRIDTDAGGRRPSRVRPRLQLPTGEASMQLHVKGKNLEVNDSMRSYVERKLQKLDRRVHDLT